MYETRWNSAFMTVLRSENARVFISNSPERPQIQPLDRCPRSKLYFAFTRRINAIWLSMQGAAVDARQAASGVSRPDPPGGFLIRWGITTPDPAQPGTNPASAKSSVLANDSSPTGNNLMRHSHQPWTTGRCQRAGLTQFHTELKSTLLHWKSTCVCSRFWDSLKPLTSTPTP